MGNDFRHWLVLVEDQTRRYYHGSEINLPKGTVLTPASERLAPPRYFGPAIHFVDTVRPATLLGHHTGVFMADNRAVIADIVGGEFLFTVRPIGKVRRHDINWLDAISQMLRDDPNDSTGLQHTAAQYWAGVPHPDNPAVWEYVAAKAKIVRDHRQTYWDEMDSN